MKSLLIFLFTTGLCIGFCFCGESGNSQVDLSNIHDKEIWEKLTILEFGDTVIYKPGDALNARITKNRKDNSIAIQYGVEEIIYDIQHVDTLKDTYVYKLTIRLDYEIEGVIEPITIKYYKLNEYLGLWDYIKDNTPVLFTKDIKKYRIVKGTESSGDW